jgi:hypothetical protein
MRRLLVCAVVALVADARRYQAAVPEPKEVEWYDSGHFLPPKADCDAAAWLARRIRTSPHAEACAFTGG